jgi:hypothetical protein
MAQSVKRIATGWTVRETIPGGTRFFAPVQTGPGAHLALCIMGTRSFSGTKWPGRSVGHSPSSNANVKERVAYTSTPAVCFHGRCWMKLSLFTY